MGSLWPHGGAEGWQDRARGDSTLDPSLLEAASFSKVNVNYRCHPYPPLALTAWNEGCQEVCLQPGDGSGRLDVEGRGSLRGGCCCTLGQSTPRRGVVGGAARPGLDSKLCCCFWPQSPHRCGHPLWQTPHTMTVMGSEAIPEPMQSQLGPSSGHSPGIVLGMVLGRFPRKRGQRGEAGEERSEGRGVVLGG